MKSTRFRIRQRVSVLQWGMIRTGEITAIYRAAFEVAEAYDYSIRLDEGGTLSGVPERLLTACLFR